MAKKPLPEKPDNRQPDNAQILRELNHAKAVFQLRAIKAVLGEVG